MPRIGFHASHELYPPSALLTFLRQAERAGFVEASCSDHFHPWGERFGQSGFAWSWLGAALEATSLPLGVVCAPGQRYHPAIIAQAVATLLDMYPGRFWLAVGSGEALNESITGGDWPEKQQRNARLRQCVEVMRALWRGETVTHRGLVTVQEATLYTRPASPPLVLGAALTPETARWLGGWADGLITAGNDDEEVRTIVEAFHEGGGVGKPLYLQAAISYGASEEEAIAAAHARWGHAPLGNAKLAGLPTARAFDAAAAAIPPEQVRTCLRCSADVKRHTEWLQKDFALGFSAVYLHFVGEDVPRFIEVFANQVLPFVGTP